MHVLIIKTSSLGDVLHMLPALTDAGKAIPGIKFDWVVEEAFAEIPSWHPLVDRVIPIAIRRWRKTPLKSLFGEEVRKFWHALRERKYDMVIDAQGLIKSGLLTWFAHGERVGLNKQSLTEPLARFAYQRYVAVDLQLHAVFRMRSIVAQALNYPMPETVADYGLDRSQFKNTKWDQGEYVMFLHGTTWDTKHWPEPYWIELAKLVEKEGLKVRIPWGNEKERQRAERIAAFCPAVHIVPRSNLREIANVIASAKMVVAVDTGLGHLSAALDVPTVSLYGPTNPKRVGTVGKGQIHLTPDFECTCCDQETCAYVKSHSDQYPKDTAAACFLKLTPEIVWETIHSNI